MKRGVHRLTAFTFVRQREEPRKFRRRRLDIGSRHSGGHLPTQRLTHSAVALKIGNHGAWQSHTLLACGGAEKGKRVETTLGLIYAADW